MSADRPPTAIPDGYRLTTLPPARTADWVAVLNSAGDLGVWDVERARKAMSAGGPTQVLPEAAQMLYRVQTPVATACLTIQGEGPTAELGWVAVHPEHRRRGLGRLACEAVLRDMSLRGYSRAFLLIDDHRVAAIRLYWNMGFRPEMTSPEHPSRWDALAEAGAVPCV